MVVLTRRIAGAEVAARLTLLVLIDFHFLLQTAANENGNFEKRCYSKNVT
jgi:hypothetical protein